MCYFYLSGVYHKEVHQKLGNCTGNSKTGGKKPTTEPEKLVGDLGKEDV